jgi:hypothetical protein
MSACAGSSTDTPRPIGPGWRPRSLALAQAGTGQVLFQAARENSSSSPAWSRWIAPGRIGIMKSQRREDHLRLALCTDREGILGSGYPDARARNHRAFAAGRTAPPETPARKATNSLQPDHRNQQPVSFDRFDVCIGSPPLGTASSRRSELERPPGDPPSLSLADRAWFHLTLPRVPAALNCRTERYDGKGNMHLQHAA